MNKIYDRLFKYKIRYWVILAIALGLLVAVKSYMYVDPLAFVSNPSSNLTGYPYLNCNASINAAPSNIVIGGCYADRIPKEPYIKFSNPLIYYIYAYNLFITIILILLCFLPNAKLKEEIMRKKNGKSRD